MDRDLRTIDRRLRNIEELLEKDDLISEKAAAELLCISRKTLQNNVYSKKLEGRYTLNAIGHRMYYKSKLLQP